MATDEGDPYLSDHPLWLLDRETGQLWCGARLSDLVRCLQPGYPARLPGNARSRLALEEARTEMATKAETRILAGVPQMDWPDVDPSSDGSLLRSMRKHGLIDFGRL